MRIIFCFEKILNIKILHQIFFYSQEELIEKLLQLKDIDLEEGESQGSKQEFDENEWKDGSLVFQQLKSTADNRFDVDRRLTFNIDKTFSSDVIDSRLTFEIPQNDRSAFCKNDEIGSLKEIYEVSSSNISFNTEPLIDPKATFDIPQKGKLLENDIDPRATFDIPQNDKKLFDGLKGNLKDENKSSNTQEKIIIQLKGITINNTQIKTNAEEKLQFESASKDERKKSYNKGQTEIKTLTVPYTRVPRR